jgi:hypothetical protein
MSPNNKFKTHKTAKKFTHSLSFKHPTFTYRKSHHRKKITKIIQIIVGHHTPPPYTT